MIAALLDVIINFCSQFSYLDLHATCHLDKIKKMCVLTKLLEIFYLKFAKKQTDKREKRESFKSATLSRLRNTRACKLKRTPLFSPLLARDTRYAPAQNAKNFIFTPRGFVINFSDPLGDEISVSVISVTSIVERDKYFRSCAGFNYIILARVGLGNLHCRMISITVFPLSF